MNPILKSIFVFTADRPQRRITDASCTLNDDIDAIFPFCSNGFTLTPPGTKLHISDSNKQCTTCAQVHCAESPRPEKLLLQETALYGQGMKPIHMLLVIHILL